MDILDELARRLAALPSIAMEELPDVLVRHQAELFDANRAQLQAGERADGSRITPEYSPATQLIKQIEGQVFDRVTLKDTGAFYASLRLDLLPDAFALDATDEKTEALLRKYGADVLGLSEEALAAFREGRVLPEVLDRLRAHFDRPL